MASKKLQIVGLDIPQSDWNQTDETQLDYIKNKPDIDGKIDTKVDKVTTSNVIYGTGMLGGQTTYQVSTSPLAGALVQRNLGYADIQVPEEPIADNAATSKKYVDDSKVEAITEAKEYIDSVKNDLLNGAGEAYDTLKELGDLIVDNKDALDVLEEIAIGKADEVHTHIISDVTNLQETLDSNLAEAKSYADEKVVYITSIDTIYSSKADLPEDSEYGDRLVVINSDEQAIYQYTAFFSGSWDKVDSLEANIVYVVLDGNKKGIYRYEDDVASFVSIENRALEEAKTYTDSGLANKLDKTDMAAMIYATDSRRRQVYLPWGQDIPTAEGTSKARIPQRTSTGDLKVPLTPSADDEATSKAYVDEKLSGKLDKTTEANKIYGTDSEGNQTEYAVSERQTAGVAMRSEGGHIELPSVPTRAIHAVPKSYADTKVARINQSWILYGNGANATPNYYYVSEATYPQNVVRRDTKSDILVIDEPVSDNGATSKKYVNGLVNPLEKRVSNLESLTLTYTQDKTVAYEKSVPAEVGTPAFIKEIGGATKKVVSRNILNPKDLNLMSTESSAPFSFTINSDGSITLTVYYALSLGAYCYISSQDFGLSTGKYYYLVESQDDVTVFDNGEYIQIEFILPYDEEKYGEQGYPDEYTFNAKIMLYKVEDSDTVEFEEAPEGTVFEPYHEPHFQNAEVSKVESLGANLIPFPYAYNGEVMDVGYKKTVNGVTFEILENGLISAIGTATAMITLQLFKKIMPEGNYYLSGKYTTGGLLIGSYNYNAPNYVMAQNGVGIINQKFTHAGGMFGAYIKIDSGVTVNSVFAPIITKDYYVSEFKPYKAEPIDTFTIPVESIKARVDGFGLDKNYIQCIDNKFEFVQKKKRAILNSKIGYWEKYVNNTTSGANVYLNAYLDNKKIGYQTSICNAFENKDVAFGSGVSGQYSDHPSLANAYFCSDIPTLAEWKAWLDAKEASGNPVVLEYELATPIVTDLTDLFTKDEIEIQQGGTLRFVNEHEMSVPNNIVYVTRKG